MKRNVRVRNGPGNSSSLPSEDTQNTVKEGNYT